MKPPADDRGRNLWRGELPPRGSKPLLVTAPYARSLGIVVQELDNELTCRMKYSDFLAGFAGLHGGTVGGLLEFASTAEMQRRCDADAKIKIVSLTVEFLRAGHLEDTFARAHIVRQGRRIANVHAEAWQGERTRLIATAQATFCRV